MKGPHRLPDFSVVVWISKNERFAAVRSELLAATNAQPYETTEYQGMADGLADTDGPATGETGLTQWMADHKDTLGRVYANELTRHFR